jgi:hypothetical protein
VGQPIGIVVAKTHALAREGARAVKVEYKELPAIISIEDAIAAGSCVLPLFLPARSLLLRLFFRRFQVPQTLCLVALWLPFAPFAV